MAVLEGILAFSCSPFGFGQNPMPSLGDDHFCEWWHARIGPAGDSRASERPKSKKPESSGEAAAAPDSDDFGGPARFDPDRVTELDEATVLAAIACLLQLEGDSRPAKFTGDTGEGVSQIFDWAPMNLAALYYVSYLFTTNWNHGNAIALRGPGANVPESKLKYRTTPWAIYKAYTSYRRWYQQVRTMGLTRARAAKLDPLEGTGLYWY